MNSHKIHHLPLIMLIAIMGFFWPLSTAAQTPLASDSELWYYEIGGAAAVSVPANAHYSRVGVNASVALSWGYSCGKFDLEAAVTNILNEISNATENLIAAMVGAAKAAIANLPAYILQRANPGLYDLFMNGLLKAEETVNIAFKDCQQMEQEIARGENPYDDWIRISMNHNWRSKINGNNQTTDIVEARDEVEDEGGDNGLPWIGGNQRGGRGQEPIHLIRDTIQAGYNALLNRAVTDTSAPTVPTSTTPARMITLWSSPQSAQEWGNDILGEHHITTCDNCSKNSEPGAGLLYTIEQNTADLVTHLIDIVNGQVPLVHNQLEAVAAPGVAISPQVIRAVRRLSPGDQALTIGRLANEISTARELEKAMLMRRLLLAGRRTPEVLAADIALEEIDASIQELEQEIDNLAFEINARKMMVSHTAQALLRLDREQLNRSTRRPYRPQQDPDALRNGAIRVAPSQ